MVKRFVFDVNSPPGLPLASRRRHGDPELGKVNANLDSLPDRLLIVNGDVSLEAVLEYYELPNLSGSYSYTLKYDGGDKACYEKELKPFLIYFHDGTTKQINDNCYVANFHKTCTYSGTQVISTILKFLKCLDVHVVELYDGSSLEQKVSLSLVKLVELGRTFYNKFGFQRMFSYHLPGSFGTRKNLDIQFEKALDEAAKIKVDDIIAYHEELFRVLSEVVRDAGVKNGVVGKDKIAHYVVINGTKHADGGIEYSAAVEILKISLGVLALNLKEGKTLHEVVVNAVKSKTQGTLSALLSIDDLPVVIKLKKGKTIRGQFLQPLWTLVQFSHGKMSMNLRKTPTRKL